MSKEVIWDCPHCGAERRTLISSSSEKVCLDLACHEDVETFKRYNLVLNPVRCLGCKYRNCIKALIKQEEDF